MYNYKTDDFHQNVTINNSIDTSQFDEFEIIAKLAEVREEKTPVLFECGVGGTVATSPLVKDGKVFFGSNDKKFYAVDAKTGREVWTFASNDSIMTSPDIEGDKIYFGSFDKNIYCLDLDGNLIWKFSTNGKIGLKTAVAEGRIFAGSEDGILYCLDSGTGDLIWKFETSRSIFSTPLIHEGRT